MQIPSCLSTRTVKDGRVRRLLAASNATFRTEASPHRKPAHVSSSTSSGFSCSMARCESFPTGHAFGQTRKDEAIDPWGNSTAGRRLKSGGWTSNPAAGARNGIVVTRYPAGATNLGALGMKCEHSSAPPLTSAATNDCRCSCPRGRRADLAAHRQQGFPPRQSGPSVIGGSHCTEIPCCDERPDTSSSFADHRIPSLGCAWPERS